MIPESNDAEQEPQTNRTRQFSRFLAHLSTLTATARGVRERVLAQSMELRRLKQAGRAVKRMLRESLNELAALESDLAEHDRRMVGNGWIEWTEQNLGPDRQEET